MKNGPENGPKSVIFRKKDDNEILDILEKNETPQWTWGN